MHLNSKSFEKWLSHMKYKCKNREKRENVTKNSMSHRYNSKSIIVYKILQEVNFYFDKCKVYNLRRSQGL